MILILKSKIYKVKIMSLYLIHTNLVVMHDFGAPLNHKA